MTTAHGPNRNRLPRAIATAAVAFAVAFAAIVWAPVAPAQAAAEVTYYVSADGDDGNAGTSPDRPWRSLAKVNATTFEPGDTILLNRGDSWTGQLWPKGSGAAGDPIAVDSYGTGAKPRIAGQGTVDEAVRLFNQEYWEIRNLDVSNQAPATGTPGENLGDFRGIGVDGDNGQVLDHFVIDSVDVHDVTGEINWIGGGADMAEPGVNPGTGWDRSKNTGGIIFTTTVPDIAAPGDPTVLNGIVVENSTIRNTSFVGVTVKQYTGDAPGAVETGWGTRRTADDPRFTPHTDVTIRGNYITQEGTEYGGNGVYLTDVQGGLVEGNVIDRVGVSGIETYAADSVTVQFNEITGTVFAGNSADANGFDPDIATTNQLFQYNYLHDNTDVILVCGCNGSRRFGSAVVRYNVVTGSTRWNLHLAQVSGTYAEIYGNTFYNTEAPNMVSGGTSGTVKLLNNVFASQRPDVFFKETSGLSYQNNAYAYAADPPSAEQNPVTGDPLFADPTVTGPYGDENGPRLDTAANFAPRAGSPLIDTGAVVADDGDRDFVGSAVPRGAGPDVGAFEAAGTAVRAVAETFDDRPTGPLANGTDGWRVVSTGNAVDVVETPSATDRSVRLSRTTGSGGTEGTHLARVFSDPLEGRVTIEARVMRDDTEGGWFGLPYVYDADGVPAVSVAFARGEIQAYEGGTARVVGDYVPGRWYRVALTVDTVGQRFSLRLDGEQVLADAALRNPLPSVGKVAWYVNGNERGAVHVDDIDVSPASDITARHSGKCVDIAGGSTADGAGILQYTCDGGAGQQWRFEATGGGYYRIVAQHSGKCLDVESASKADGARIVQWTCHGHANQQWRLRAVGGHVQIIARHSGKCLDVTDSSTADSARLEQWGCHDGHNQQWDL